MSEYDKENLKKEIEKTKERLLILQTIPSDAKLFYLSQGNVITGFTTRNGERIYV